MTESEFQELEGIKRPRNAVSESEIISARSSIAKAMKEFPKPLVDDPKIRLKRFTILDELLENQQKMPSPVFKMVADMGYECDSAGPMEIFPIPDGEQNRLGDGKLVIYLRGLRGGTLSKMGLIPKSEHEHPAS